MFLDNFLDNELELNILEGVINELAEPAGVIEVRRVPTYNEGYVEETVPSYTPSEFKSHFRMSRAAVEELCVLLAPHLHQRHLFISLEKKVLFFIWTLAKQESFLATSDRFGFSKGSGHYTFMKIMSGIVLLKDRLIQWPNGEDCAVIANRIQGRCGKSVHIFNCIEHFSYMCDDVLGIPGIVGAIDGCHITIKQPVNNAVDYYNRKEQHSVILQGVCDDRKVFTDIFIGMPGRVHDARVFRNSPLYGQLIGNPPLLRPDQHLIGDAAYPLLLNLLKPFRDNGHLTQRQITFNQVLSSQRSVIERAFGLLKGIC